jgi:hypothetical protein
MGVLQEEKKKATKAKMSRNHLICGKLINTYKLGANSNGRNFLNYKH